MQRSTQTQKTALNSRSESKETPDRGTSDPSVLIKRDHIKEAAKAAVKEAARKLIASLASEQAIANEEAAQALREALEALENKRIEAGEEKMKDALQKKMDVIEETLRRHTESSMPASNIDSSSLLSSECVSDIPGTLLIYSCTVPIVLLTSELDQTYSHEQAAYAFSKFTPHAFSKFTAC